MIKLQAPVRYRHWTGKPRDLPDADTMRTLWKEPVVECFYVHNEENGTLEIDHQVYTVPENPWWIHLGFAPTPKNKWERFWMDIHHGRLMRYPWASVVAFAIFNMKNKKKEDK